MTSYTIRAAAPTDVPRMLSMVREGAEYHQETSAVLATEGHYTSVLFPDRPEAASIRALVGEVDGEVVAMVVWYVTFSSWTGRHGIWVEDLYVRLDQRRSGLGSEMLAHLAGIVVENQWLRLEWHVLRSNTPTLAFYNRLGAHPMDEWVHYRMDGAELAALAARRTG
jgi:GNAT superfamily N-acetyltransferase